MRKHSLLYWLLLPPALLLCAVSLGIAGLVLSTVPPLVSWVAVVLVAVVVAWLVFGRRKSGSVVPGSETSLLGRQSSKEGLL